MERQTICTIFMWNKGLISTIYKELLKLNNKSTKNLIRRGTKKKKSFFPKEGERRMIRLSASLTVGKCKLKLQENTAYTSKNSWRKPVTSPNASRDAEKLTYTKEPLGNWQFLIKMKTSLLNIIPDTWKHRHRHKIETSGPCLPSQHLEGSRSRRSSQLQ